MIYLSKGGSVPIRTISGSAPESYLQTSSSGTKKCDMVKGNESDIGKTDFELKVPRPIIQNWGFIFMLGIFTPQA